MPLSSTKDRLSELGIFHSETTLGGQPCVVGYQKQFRWSWMATQLNCFVVAVDCGDSPITPDSFETLFAESFAYAKSHYTGWPRGLQSGMGVMLLLVGSEVSQEAQDYCVQLKSGKKWAGFSIPLAKSTSDGQSYCFAKKPAWGRIYYGYFETLAKDILQSLKTNQSS